MSPLTITFFVSLAISFAAAWVATRPASSSKTARKRLFTIQDSVRPQPAGVHGAELDGAGERRYSARLGDALERYGFARQLKVLLIHADSGMGVGGAVLASVGAAFVCGLICFFFLRSPLLAGAATLAGSSIHYGVLRFKRNRRLKAFNAALPDAIELMSRSLQAGHSMGSSIEMIAEQSPEPLAFEFVQVYQQQRLGLHFRDALLQMGGRIPSRDLQFLITAILVQKETGGDLTEILARASHVIRERVHIEGEVRTRTAQGRLTGWVLGLFPVVMLVLLNVVSPGYSSILFHDPIGQELLYAGGALILLGGLTIRKVVDVQV